MKSTYWLEINEDENPTGGVCHAFYEDDKPTVGKWILVQQIENYTLPNKVEHVTEPVEWTIITPPTSFGNLGSFYRREGNRMFISRKQSIKDFPAGFIVHKETEIMECRFNNYYNDKFVSFSQTDSYEVEGWHAKTVDIGPVA